MLQGLGQPGTVSEQTNRQSLGLSQKRQTDKQAWFVHALASIGTSFFFCLSDIPFCVYATFSTHQLVDSGLVPFCKKLFLIMLL